MLAGRPGAVEEAGNRGLHHGIEDHGVVVSRAFVAGGKRLQSVQLAGKALQVVDPLATAS